MPLKKFRSVEEMGGETLRPIGSPELEQAIARVWSFAARTTKARFPPGVFKHGSIEEAQEQRARWQEANLRAYWESQRNLASEQS